MAGKQPDRRVRRTTHRLKEALLGLINKRPYEAITVQEITQRADVGRSTFYSHYTSKDELLFSGFDRWLLSLVDHVPANGAAHDGFRFSLPLLRHAETQKRFLQATVIGGSDPRVRQKTTALMVAVARRELERLAPVRGPGTKQDAIAHEARAHGVAGAFLGVMAWWLSRGGGAKPSAETVDEIFQRLVAP